MIRSTLKQVLQYLMGKAINADQARKIAKRACTSQKIDQAIVQRDEVNLIADKLLGWVETRAEMGLDSFSISVGGYSETPLNTYFELRFEATALEVQKIVEEKGFKLNWSISHPSPWVQPEEEYFFGLSWKDDKCSNCNDEGCDPCGAVVAEDCIC